MRLNSLHLQNFRQHADTRIDFDLGLTGIIGANGAGKSTVLEAIAWALYGNPAARGTRETIRFNRAGPRASVRVELDFEAGTHRYRVVRGLTSAELYLDNSPSPIANSITGVTELLRRRLGMTREEFFNTYFTGQKELNVMAAMGPSERAQFLSRVLGYERLRTAQNLVRERRRTIIAEISGLRSAMPDPDAVARQLLESGERVGAASRRVDETSHRRAGAVGQLSALAPRWIEAQRERDRWQELSAELRVAESEALGIARDLERLALELREMVTARSELEKLSAQLSPMLALAAELQHLDDLYREEGRRQALSESIKALEEGLARLRERHERIAAAPTLEETVTEQLEAKRRALEQAQGTLEARRTEWVRDRQEAETKRDALRQQFAELREQRERLVAAGENGMCPTCARPLGGHFRTVLDLLDSQIETVRVDGKYFKDRLEQLEEMPADIKALDETRRGIFIEVGNLERRLAKVQHAVQELGQLTRELWIKDQRLSSLQGDLSVVPGGYDRARHEAVRAELERLGPLDQRAARLGAQIDREPHLTRERDRAVETNGTLQARLTELRERRAAAVFSEDAFMSLRSEHERAANEARAAERGGLRRGRSSTARAAREAAEKTQQALERSQARLAALQADKRLHDELDRAFNDIRTDLNQQLRPEISELASAFLDDLTDARYSELELDDQYNIIVLEDGVPKPVISGGEEDLANLVLRLAISQMIAERAGQSFSLLILDEVFGSLDESRRHNVVELLRRLHDRFEQVILITHIESVREGLDRVVMVRYDEEAGCSRVEQTDGGAVRFDEAAD